MPGYAVGTYKEEGASYIQKSVQYILSVFTEVYTPCQISHME